MHYLMFTLTFPDWFWFFLSGTGSTG